MTSTDTTSTDTTSTDLVDLSEISLVSEQNLSDPFQYFNELLEREPVIWNKKQKAWLLARHADVTAAFRDEKIGSDRIGPYLASRVPEEDKERFRRMFEILSKWMVFLGPPDHTRLRGLVHKSFTPRRIKTLQGRIEEAATEMAANLKARLDSGDSVDLVADYCVPLPGKIIAEMFGVPVEDGIRLKHWAEELGLFINGALRDPDRNSRVAVAMQEFEDYLQVLIDQYRATPADNILSGLVAANDDDDTLTEDELIATCMLILDAGYKTIQNALANAFLVLMQNPDQWNLLATQPELIKTGVEEFLRFAGPGQVQIRRAAAQVEYGGQTINVGDRVYLLTGAANRDPEVFTDPNEFKLDRRDNPHVMFGQGIHFCLGASLARMEMATAITTLLRELPRLELAIQPDELNWHRVLILHGVERLPVRIAQS